MISDPHDSFGNGAPGVFINQPYATAGAKGSGEANGIHPSDNQTYWSTDAFCRLEIIHPGVSGVSVNGFPMVMPEPGNSIGTFALNKTHRLDFTEPGGKIDWITAPRASLNAQPGDLLRFVLPKPLGMVALAFDSSGFGQVPPVPTMAAFEAATGNAWFVDATTSELYLSLVVGPKGGAYFYY
jgi:hypothetical protein